MWHPYGAGHHGRPASNPFVIHDAKLYPHRPQGVAHKFEYKMRLVYAHFPINANIINGGKASDSGMSRVCGGGLWGGEPFLLVSIRGSMGDRSDCISWDHLLQDFLRRGLRAPLGKRGAGTVKDGSRNSLIRSPLCRGQNTGLGGPCFHVRSGIGQLQWSIDASPLMIGA